MIESNCIEYDSSQELLSTAPFSSLQVSASRLAKSTPCFASKYVMPACINQKQPVTTRL